MLKKISSGLTATLLSLAPSAMAQIPDFNTIPDKTGGPKTLSQLVMIIAVIIQWIQWGLFAAATVLILLAAYDYLFSKGDPQKIKTAQDTLLYAVIALVVGVVAGGLPKVILEIFNIK